VLSAKLGAEEKDNMPINVNCQHFKQTGHCTHHAAPRKLWGLPSCVLMHPPADPRLSGCRLVYPHAKPDGYPPMPPNRILPWPTRRDTTPPIMEPDNPRPRA